MAQLDTPWTESIIYQIYPRSFNDANGDGVGDIPGIIQKLDYLDDLGIDAIWISPMYKSLMADFGYDVQNYREIDPLFGTMEDMEKLIEESHKRGIKIMMDFIPNHTSNQHRWFLESRSSRDNPKRDWYIWKDPSPDGGVPNNWQSIFGGPAWKYDERTDQYYLHTFLKEQPDLNWRNPDVVLAMMDIVRFWLDKGVDGIRVDAFAAIYKDARFRDEPMLPEQERGKQPYEQLKHIYTLNQPELKHFIEEMQKVLDERDNTFMVTEPLPQGTQLDILLEFYTYGKPHLHAPFNFHFILLPWDIEEHKQFINEFEEQLQDGYSPNYVLGNHDQSRIASRIGSDEARTAAMMLLTLRGIPFIYYGDEIGMEDAQIPVNKLIDPHRREDRYGNIVSRDPERTPMQWSNDIHAGFSENNPWLPVESHFQTRNVEVEKEMPNSMLNLYKKLIQTRKESHALLYGSYQYIDVKNPYIFAFMRKDKDDQKLVILNFSRTDQTVSLPMGTATCLVSTYLDCESGNKRDLQDIHLRPTEGLIFDIHEKK